MAYLVKPTLARMLSMGLVGNLWQSKVTVAVPKTENQLIIEALAMPEATHSILQLNRKLGLPLGHVLG
jgi:hypothetical protein